MFDFSETMAGKSEDGWYACQTSVWGDAYKKCAFDTQKRLGDIGFISNIIENHDEPRGVSHYLPEGCNSESAKKMLAAVNVMLRGLPFIYQGQEIGMTNVSFSSIDEIDDCTTRHEYDQAIARGLSEEEALHVVSHFTRDNARTPFQWNDSPQAGFTTGTPWLKLNPNYITINAAEQIERPDSLYHWYKDLLSLRKSPVYGETVVYGEFAPYLEEQTNLMAFYRNGESGSLLVVANYQPEPQDVELPDGYRKVLMNNIENFLLEGNTLHMDGFQVVILG